MPRDYPHGNLGLSVATRLVDGIITYLILFMKISAQEKEKAGQKRRERRGETEEIPWLDRQIDTSSSSASRQETDAIKLRNASAYKKTNLSKNIDCE